MLFGIYDARVHGEKSNWKIAVNDDYITHNTIKCLLLYLI